MWYWDIMLSTEVQCWGSTFWYFNAQKEATWRGGHAKQKRNLAFSGGKSGWNWLKFSWGNPDPLAHHFPQDSLPWIFGTMSKHIKTPCLGWEVATFREAAQRERQGDTWTGKQNSSTTVGKSLFSGKSRSGLPSLATAGMIWAAKIGTAFSRYFRVRSLFGNQHLCWRRRSGSSGTASLLQGRCHTTIHFCTGNSRGSWKMTTATLKAATVTAECVLSCSSLWINWALQPALSLALE